MLKEKPYPQVAILRGMADFTVDGMAIPYAEFVPRLYESVHRPRVQERADHAVQGFLFRRKSGTSHHLAHKTFRYISL